MAERAEELREQLDVQRADISRTVEQIENRVAPGRVLSRRKYRMRRSVMDFKDRVMGNDQPDYPTHWYAQPAAPLAPEYGGQYAAGATYGDEQGGRLDGARERAGEVSGRASDAMHGMGDRASGTVQGMSDRVHDAPQSMRRQTQGSPMAMGLVAFGAGVVAAALLPETDRERRLARQAEPQLQQAVAGAREVGTGVVADLREPAQESLEQVKGTATSEAQALKEEATQEAKTAKSDVQAKVKE